MAEATFELDQLSKKSLLVWSISTQARFESSTTMKIGEKQIFKIKKPYGDTVLKLFGQGSYDHNEDGCPMITISIPSSQNIKPSVIAGTITDVKARVVGYSYSICIEDWTDDDFNDVYVNVIWWNKKKLR